MLCSMLRYAALCSAMLCFSKQSKSKHGKTNQRKAATEREIRGRGWGCGRGCGRGTRDSARNSATLDQTVCTDKVGTSRQSLSGESHAPRVLTSKDKSPAHRRAHRWRKTNKDMALLFCQGKRAPSSAVGFLSLLPFSSPLAVAFLFSISRTRGQFPA